MPKKEIVLEEDGDWYAHDSCFFVFVFLSQILKGASRPTTAGAEFGTDEEETCWERILESERERERERERESERVFLGFVQCFFCVAYDASSSNGSEAFCSGLFGLLRHQVGCERIGEGLGRRRQLILLCGEKQRQKAETREKISSCSRQMRSEDKRILRCLWILQFDGS